MTIESPRDEDRITELMQRYNGCLDSLDSLKKERAEALAKIQEVDALHDIEYQNAKKLARELYDLGEIVDERY